MREKVGDGRGGPERSGPAAGGSARRFASGVALPFPSLRAPWT